MNLTIRQILDIANVNRVVRDAFAKANVPLDDPSYEITQEDADKVAVAIDEFDRSRPRVGEQNLFWTYTLDDYKRDNYLYLQAVDQVIDLLRYLSTPRNKLYTPGVWLDI